MTKILFIPECEYLCFIRPIIRLNDTTYNYEESFWCQSDKKLTIEQFLHEFLVGNYKLNQGAFFKNRLFLAKPITREELEIIYD